MTAGLSRQTARGINWTFASQLVKQVVRIGTVAALARLLSPHDFGLVSAGLVVTGFVNLFNDLGTSAAVIQRESPTQRLLATTFWTNTMTGFGLTAVVAAAAPLIADFYREPALTNIVRLLGCSFAIASLGLVQQALLAKTLQFRKLAIIETGAPIIGAAVAIATAATGSGAYSLVYQTLATTAVTSVGYCVGGRWLPTFEFSPDDIRSIRSFSSNLVGFNVVNYFARNGDYLLIGRFLGTQDLGYYTLGYNLLLLPLQLFTSSVSRVMFPAYASIGEDIPRIARAYRRAAGAVAIVAFPTTLVLLVLCDQLVNVIYGPGWRPAIAVIAVLAPLGIPQSIAAMNGSIYQAQGRTDLQLRVGLVIGTSAMASFVVGLHWGITGVAAAYTIAMTALGAYPSLTIPLRLIGLRLRDVFPELRGPFIASLLMATVVGVLRLTLPGAMSGAVGLVALVAIAALAYCVFSLMFSKRQLHEIIRVISPAFSARLAPPASLPAGSG